MLHPTPPFIQWLSPRCPQEGDLTVMLHFFAHLHRLHHLLGHKQAGSSWEHLGNVSDVVTVNACADVSVSRGPHARWMM
jgi:hypothetical protein